MSRNNFSQKSTQISKIKFKTKNPKIKLENLLSNNKTQLLKKHSQNRKSTNFRQIYE